MWLFRHVLWMPPVEGLEAWSLAELIAGERTRDGGSCSCANCAAAVCFALLLLTQVPAATSLCILNCAVHGLIVAAAWLQSTLAW
jgi:hypothetical protein